jgi:hypothetical protein
MIVSVTRSALMVIQVDGVHDEISENLWPITTDGDGVSLVVPHQDRSLAHFLQLDCTSGGDDVIVVIDG